MSRAPFIRKKMYKFAAIFLTLFVKAFITLLQYTAGVLFSIILAPFAALCVVIDYGDVSAEEVKKWAYFWYYPYLLK